MASESRGSVAEKYFHLARSVQFLRSFAILATQEGLVPVISLPGGGSSELDIVMKLHKVERHIRNNKLKARCCPHHAPKTDEMRGMCTSHRMVCLLRVMPNGASPSR